MSQNYKFKSLQIHKNSRQVDKEPDQSKVFEIGDTKTIDFELLDGTRQNFSYAHYMTSWIGKDGDERVIKIFFATHLITIKGYCLDPIYDALSSLKLKKVKASDERYLKTTEDGKVFVTDIEVKWKRETLQKT